MEAPERIEVKGLADYLDVMSKAVFQSGISWKVVDAKWPSTREAFHGFDPETVAALTPDDIDALAIDTRVIRNRRKLEAVVTNARQLLALDHEHGSFRAYLRSHDSYAATEVDLRRRFKFLGDVGIYCFLWIVGEDVPDYDSWCIAHGRAPHAVA